MSAPMNAPSQHGLRWPATPLAWLALVLLIPLATAAGLLCGVLAPLIWIVVWLAPT